MAQQGEKSMAHPYLKRFLMVFSITFLVGLLVMFLVMAAAIMGLFGGDDETKAPATTAPSSMEEDTTNLETTAEGSSQGSEETGDAGIALAATICVAASAAFVLTRKKKETV